MSVLIWNVEKRMLLLDQLVVEKLLLRRSLLVFTIQIPVRFY